MRCWSSSSDSDGAPAEAPPVEEAKAKPKTKALTRQRQKRQMRDPDAKTFRWRDRILMTWSEPGAGPAGRWQCTCPFHDVSEKARCTRTVIPPRHDECAKCIVLKKEMDALNPRTKLKNSACNERMLPEDTRLQADAGPQERTGADAEPRAAETEFQALCFRSLFNESESEIVSRDKVFDHFDAWMFRQLLQCHAEDGDNANSGHFDQ